MHVCFVIHTGPQSIDSISLGHSPEHEPSRIVPIVSENLFSVSLPPVCSNVSSKTAQHAVVPARHTYRLCKSYRVEEHSSIGMIGRACWPTSFRNSEPVGTWYLYATGWFIRHIHSSLVLIRSADSNVDVTEPQNLKRNFSAAVRLYRSETQRTDTCRAVGYVSKR